MEEDDLFDEINPDDYCDVSCSDCENTFVYSTKDAEHWIDEDTGEAVDIITCIYCGREIHIVVPN